MKKLLVLSAILSGIILSFQSNATAAGGVKPPQILLISGPVKVEGRQLMVDFDGNGVYEPYVIKGVGYSPYPIGRNVEDWGWPQGDPRIANIFDDPTILNRDFGLLQAMYANTIRLWKGNDTQQLDGRFPVKLTTQTLNLAESHGLKVIAGFWINTSGSVCTPGGIVYDVPDFANPTVRNDYIDRFVAYVNMFKNHPAILFWAIGNENNLHLDPNNVTQINAWYSLVNDMAREAHEAEGDTYHPVAVINGDLQYIGDPASGATDSAMPYLDIWGANVYRGSSFGTLFNEYTAKSTKPLWIAEYGIDAWYSESYINSPISQYRADLQDQWDRGLWDQITANKSVAIGATVMEYSDEWWKPTSWVGDSSHNFAGTGPVDQNCPPDGIPDWYPPFPDHFINAEWFGLVSVAPNPPYGADLVTPRDVYYSLQNRFSCNEAALNYASPDNGKSCDGTSACCSNSNYKAKNGACVVACPKGWKKD